MKKSAFKALLRETLMEVLPDVIRIVNESYGVNNHKNNLSETPNISAIHSGRKRLTDSIVYENLPNNPKENIDGKTYVSGKGIMEWVKKRGGTLPAVESEFNHTEEDVNKLLGKLGLVK